MPKRKLQRKKRVPKGQLRINNVKVLHPTSKSTWKGFERKVAAMFGTKRVPLSGSNSGHNTNSDSLHPTLYIECKVRQKVAIWSLFVDTENKAKAEDKTPVVALKQKGERGILLVVRPEDLDIIAKIYTETQKKSKEKFGGKKK